MNNYKKFLFGFLLLICVLHINKVSAIELAEGMSRDMGSLEDRLGGGELRGEGGGGDLTPGEDGGFGEPEGGNGLGSATVTQDERQLGEVSAGAPPKGAGMPEDDGFGDELPAGGNPTQGFEDLRVSRGPDGEHAVDGESGVGKPREDGEPRAGAEGGATDERPVTEEAPREVTLTDKDIDEMSDEGLMDFKAKPGEDSAALTKAQDALRAAGETAKAAKAAVETSTRDLAKATTEKDVAESAEKDAASALKESHEEFFGEDGKVDFYKLSDRVDEIQALIKENRSTGGKMLKKKDLEEVTTEMEEISKYVKAHRDLEVATKKLSTAADKFRNAEGFSKRAGDALMKARGDLQAVIKGMNAARMATMAGTLGNTGGDAAKATPQQQAGRENDAAVDQKAEAEKFDKAIKDQDDVIAFEKSRKEGLKEPLAKARGELSELEGKRSEAMANANTEKISELDRAIAEKKAQIKSMEKQSYDIDKDIKKAEEERAALVEKKDALGRAQGEDSAVGKSRDTLLTQDLRKLKKKLSGGEGPGRMARAKKYLTETSAKDMGKDALDGIYGGTKKSVTWAVQKTKKFGVFLWDQMKIGFAFMIPGDIVATIQAAYQAAAMYKMITSVQNFAGINMYTVDGLIPRSDATNGVFLYTDTSDGNQYTSPDRRFFMSYSNYGDIGTNYLGSGAVSFMIEFSTGFIFDNNGDPLVYGFPGVPLKNVKGFAYSGTSGSNNTITTVISEILPNVRRDVSGGVKREVKVDGLLEGFSKVNSTPAGNSTIAGLLAEPRGSLPTVFNSSLNVLRQGIRSTRFGMSFCQPEGLGIVAYLLTHYKNVFELEAKGKAVDATSVEMRLIEKLAEGMTIGDFDKLATGGTYQLNEESLKGLDPATNLLLGNVFVYQTDDTPIVGLMRNVLPKSLKPHVHDYVVGINAANAVAPILIPMVNIPAGSATAISPVITWGINPDIAYVISLVSGATYCPGAVILMNNGLPDYTNANTLWGQVTAASGNSTAYGGVAGFTNQLNAMQQLAQFMIEKGPFNLNGRYKAYRVEGLEDMYDSAGLTDSDLQKARSAMLLGMAANQSGAQIASSDKLYIKDKKTDVKNGIFVYRIDNALAGGTLPDYVLPIMVNSAGNYQIIPLGSQAVASKDGSFGDSTSNQVQALVSLVTSRMYDANYNPLPKNYVTNILTFQTPGVPIQCDPTGTYSPYTCTSAGVLVEPNGQNQPLATAFMETEFNPANQSTKEFSMPPYHFLMMPYDIAPIDLSQQQTTVFGNVGTLGTVQTLPEPLYEVLPEIFTGIPWPATITQNLKIYEKFLSGFSSPVGAAIQKSGQTAAQNAQFAASQKVSDETKILNQLLTRVETLAHPNVFDARSLSIAQVHDKWKGNLVKQLIGKDASWYQEWEVGPFNIAKSVVTLPASSPANASTNPVTVNTNWSITLLNEECVLNNHYIYTLTNNQSTTINGLWVLAQLDGYKKAIDETKLNTITASLATRDRRLDKINGLSLVSMTLPSAAAGITSKVLQQNMINYYNLQPRADGCYYGIASTQVQNMGHLENLFVNIGQSFQDLTKESSTNALIDLLSGRVLILTNSGDKQTFLLPLVNIQGCEVTVDPALILKTFSDNTLDASLSAYIQQNTVGFSGPAYTAYFGNKQMMLPRQALDSGNYIYEYASSNPIKPVDYLTPVQSINGAPFFNLPLEQDVQIMVSLVDYERISPQSIAGQNPVYLTIKNVSTPQERINYSLFTTNYFNISLLSQDFLDKIQAAKKIALEVIAANTPPVVQAAPVNQDLLDANAIINYQENAEFNKNYFDPTTLSQNNLTHSGESDSVFGGNFFLYNDSSSNYFLGVGNMTGAPDSEVFDTYYAFSLQGYMGSAFPLTSLQGPVGGYYAKNDAGKYALTQVVFGPTAQHIASTYGIYIDPKDGSQHLGIPLPVKSLFMDQATDMNLQGGKKTGTFMRFIKPLPPVLDGYTYYLYENIAIPGLIPSSGQLGIKMTPSAYLLQINPAQGPAYYIDLMTGLGYDIKGQPLPEQAKLYKRSDQPLSSFNPLITWGNLEALQVLVPFTNSTILSSLIANSLAAQGQSQAFVVYATTLANVVFNYQDPVTNKVYSYSRSATPGGVIDGNVYQTDFLTGKSITIYNSAQIVPGDTSAIATDMSKKIDLSNKNMLAALQDATKKGYSPYTTVYTLQPLTIDLTLAGNSPIVLPAVTATHDIAFDKWSLSYAVTDPTTTLTTTVKENYFATVDSQGNQQYQVLLLNGLGSYDATALSSGQIQLTTFNGMSASSLNLIQQVRDSFIINSFNSNTSAYDTISSIIASGTIFRPGPSGGSFSNTDIGATISYQVGSGQPFMPAFIDPALSKNVVSYQFGTLTTPRGTNYNNCFFNKGTMFAYSPMYVSTPQENFTAYFIAWGCEPEVSTEGTVVLVDYLTVDQLMPITADKVYVDRNATLGELNPGQGGVISIEEYISWLYGKKVDPLNKIQQDLADAAKAVVKKTNGLATKPSGAGSGVDSAELLDEIKDDLTDATSQTAKAKPTASIPSSNHYVTTALSRITQKQGLQSARQQVTGLYRAAAENLAMQNEMHNQFGNTVWGPVFSAMPPQADAANARLYYDANSGYVVYKIGEYDQGADFYNITGITEGYILMPMIFKDKGQGVQLSGLPSTYRLSGIVFDTDGQTIHEVVSMKDLNGIEKSIGSLGTLEADRQSAQQIIFDVKIQLPQVQDVSLVSTSTSTTTVTGNGTPAPQPTVVDTGGGN